MFLKPLFFASKGIPHVKYEKKNYRQCPFLYFFHIIEPNLAQILPQDHTHFDFFCPVSSEICWGIQLILITSIGIK